MKLYYSPAACSLAVHIALVEAGLDYRLERVDLPTHRLADGGDYRSINAKGYVPLLVTDEGIKLTEAQVLLQYVADRVPGKLAPVFGTFERYRLMEWLNFIATEIHKAFAPLWNPRTPEAYRSMAIQDLGNRFDYLVDTLAKQPYLMQGGFSVADAYLYTVLNWSSSLKVDLGKWPALTQYLERVSSRPAVRRALQEENLLRAAA
ncbi:MAG TPA: glutathione transferase GstA [Casimicrobiaceae bacterium]|nr:glutathione transferase GstA [Casimicrobiaceae bacterium]